MSLECALKVRFCGRGACDVRRERTKSRVKNKRRSLVPCNHGEDRKISEHREIGSQSHHASE